MEQIDLFDAYLEQNNMWHFEGPRGVSRLTKITREVCGYNDSWGNNLETFFQDNPGAIEAVVCWIREQNNDEWAQNLREVVDTSDMVDVEEELDE